MLGLEHKFEFLLYCSFHFTMLPLAEDAMQKELNKWASWYQVLTWKWFNFQESTLSLRIDGHPKPGAESKWR